MDDSLEELEPLFDYHRVQPLNVISLDDDDDDSPIAPTKKRKISNPKDEKKDAKKADIVVVDCDDIDDKDTYDYDLLLTPPSLHSEDVPNSEEDTFIKELRQKKEELASFAKSSEDIWRAVEESAKREEEASQRTSPKKADAPLPKASSDRAKIVISIQGKDGQKQFRIYADDKFERLFKMYADKMKLHPESLVFTFDGEKINPTSTPVSLDMEDDDIIEVNVKSS